MKDPNFIEPKEWYKTLPKKRSSSGVLFLNKEGEVLIVKTNYQKSWSIPGGVIDAGESPAEAAVREIKEELGLDIKTPKLLCVDSFVPGGEEIFKGDSIIFIFLGEVLDEKEIEAISLQELEIDKFKFVLMDEALILFKPKLSKRLGKCFEAIKAKTVIYLENSDFPS